MVVMAVIEVAMIVVVLAVVGGEIVVVKVADEDYLMNVLVRFGTHHRLDLNHRS